VAYRIEYSPEAEDHLMCLSARDSRTVLDTVVVQLAHQPTVSTRNRKLMKANRLAPWELRIGSLRVYYEVKARVVIVKAVGFKDRDRVWIGGEEIEV